MTTYHIFVLIAIALFFVLLPCWGIALCFKKAGIPQWKAYIPFYNTWVMANAAQVKKYWFFVQFVPIVGWFATMVIYIEFSKLFTKYKFYQHAAASLLPMIYFPYIGLSNNYKNSFVGVEVAKRSKKSKAREWADAAVFAIVAATIIRTFVFEAFTIPTSSMEKTLLVNDYLFVSKMRYGPRIPNTPISMPFVHHSLPGSKIPSYIEWPRIPYVRWFGKDVNRNDIVVFNLPAGDTLTREYDSQVPYYDILRARENEAFDMLKQNGKDSISNMNLAKTMTYDEIRSEFTIATRPVDKRENYIKRCVGVGGDKVQVINGVLHVNGAPSTFNNPSTFYTVVTKSIALDEDMLKQAGIRINMGEGEGSSIDFQVINAAAFTYKINLNTEELKKLNALQGISSVTLDVDKDKTAPLFPYCYNRVDMGWRIDNFGPLWIPKRGATIELTRENIALYERAIKVYEQNEFEVRNGKAFINGKEASSYTFKMNYYWMMGDNRHKSQDSRFWGYVPEDHIVGSPSVIWMSTEKGIRWKRMFTMPK
jgi:signal peptidase I